MYFQKKFVDAWFRTFPQLSWQKEKALQPIGTSAHNSLAKTSCFPQPTTRKPGSAVFIIYPEGGETGNIWHIVTATRGEGWR